MSETEQENKLVLPCPTTRPCLPDHRPSSPSTPSLFAYFSQNYIGNFNSKPWKLKMCLCAHVQHLYIQSCTENLANVIHD